MMNILLLFFGLVLVFGFTVMFGAPYVPSRKKLLREVFTKLYKLDKRDCLIDLGSGDGVVLKIASAEFGAKSIGIELNPIIALISKIRLLKVTGARVVCKNFYSFKFPAETTVVYVFGDSRDITKIYQKVQREVNRLNKKIVFISLAFEILKQKPVAKHGAYLMYEIIPKAR